MCGPSRRDQMNLALEKTVPLFQNVKKVIFVQPVFHMTFCAQ